MGLGLWTVKEDSILEIVDVNKQLSQGKCLDVHIVMGSTTTIANLKMMKLLSQVDIILGMYWLLQ